MLEKIQELNLYDTAEMRGITCKKCILSNLPKEVIGIEIKIYIRRILSIIILWKFISEETNVDEYISILENPGKISDDLDVLKDLCSYSKKCKNNILRDKGLLYYRYGSLLCDFYYFIPFIDLLEPYKNLYDKGLLHYLSVLLSEVSPTDEEHLRKKSIDLVQRFMSYSCEKSLPEVEKTIMNYHRLIV